MLIYGLIPPMAGKNRVKDSDICWAQWFLDVDEREKKSPHVWVVPNGTSTIYELENQKKEMILWGPRQKEAT